MKPPNIIYILTDDQRAELLGAAGHPFLKTPHLDALALQSTRFTAARCTSPLCTPSRVSHYLGQWERRHAVNFNSQTAVSSSAWMDSFPGRLKKAGYFTAWIGKNHVPVGEGGYRSGFMESWFDCWYGNHNHSTFYPKELPNDRGAIYKNASLDTQAEIFAEGALNVIKPEEKFIANAPMSFQSRPNGQPFVMCVTFNLPHGSSCSTMQGRPGDDQLYKAGYRDHIQEAELPSTWKSWKSSYAKLPREVYNGVWIPDYDYVKTPHDLRERIIRQCQVITGIDRFIGQLRHTLEDIGEADNTVIVFSTDHGLMFGEHGLGGKALLYEPALRIPLIIHDPRDGMARGRVCDAMVAVPDLAPTVLDLCGLKPASCMQGQSLVPLLKSDSDSGWQRETLFIENQFDEQNYPRCHGVIHQKWKYLRYEARDEDPQQLGSRLRGTLNDYMDCRLSDTYRSPIYEELFNLEADSQEVHNLIHDAAISSGWLEELKQRCHDKYVELCVNGQPPRVSVRS